MPVDKQVLKLTYAPFGRYSDSQGRGCFSHL